MTRVFLGGSLRVARLDPSVLDRLDRIIAKGFPVLVGDANGADKALQHHLFQRRYSSVTVFCSGGLCRNNVGGWTTRSVAVDDHLRGRDFYSEKDRVMAAEASAGLMIWDGQSLGTLMNVFRLASQRKPVVIYAASQKAFHELRNIGDWQALFNQLGPGLRHKVVERIAREAVSAEGRSLQPSGID